METELTEGNCSDKFITKTNQAHTKFVIGLLNSIKIIKHFPKFSVIFFSCDEFY